MPVAHNLGLAGCPLTLLKWGLSESFADRIPFLVPTSRNRLGFIFYAFKYNSWRGRGISPFASALRLDNGFQLNFPNGEEEDVIDVWT